MLTPLVSEGTAVSEASGVLGRGGGTIGGRRLRGGQWPPIQVAYRVHWPSQSPTYKVVTQLVSCTLSP